MSFAIPSLTALTDRVRHAFRANLPGTDAWVWPNNVTPTAKVIAGAVFEIYGRLDYVQRQKFAITADGEGLDRHGEEFGLARRAAEAATGSVVFTAAEAIAVAPGAILTRADGASFTVAAAGSLPASGTLALPVVASAPGKSGNTAAGAPLGVASGVSGAATAAVDDFGLVGGTDVEGDEAFRARILFRKRNPPHGGSPADYVMWCTAVAGVTRVFIERRWIGAGTVRVFVLTDDLTPGGIPSALKVEEVDAYVQTLAPAGANVSVVGPAAFPIQVEVNGLSPDTPTLREAVLAELRDAIGRLGRVAGTDTPHPVMPYLATPQTFSRSWLWQAVANASGEERHSIAAPSADLAIPAGMIPTLGTVTFT